MSHVSDHVQTNEISNQVLYNKVIVQLALAAFRLGYITDVHVTLQELIGTMKLKELLSQSKSLKYKINISFICVEFYERV